LSNLNRAAHNIILEEFASEIRVPKSRKPSSLDGLLNTEEEETKEGENGT
jgi:hypothetical protein